MLKSVYIKVPYHNSILTGKGWVMELLAGHSECIHYELGMHQHVFTELIMQLQLMGYTRSRYVTLEEQVAIFLYTSITGLTIRHMGERFQRSNTTISQWVPFHSVHGDVFIVIAVTFAKSFPPSLQICFTTHTCACRQHVTLFHQKSARIPNSGRSSRTVWVHWMVLIFIPCHLLCPLFFFVLSYLVRIIVLYLYSASILYYQHFRLPDTYLRLPRSWYLAA